MKWIHNICCLRLIYCVIYIIYIPFCFITFFHLSRSLIIPFFQNCWDLFVKYFSRCVFFRFGAIYHEKNFFITGTNNWIEQDLGSTEGAIECPNQTVTTFFLCNICTEVLHCRNIVDLPILVIFLLWRFWIYQADCNIF